MKLIMSIVQIEDRDELLDALTQAEFRATCISTEGAFLRVGNATVLIGTEDAKVPDVLKLIEKNCHARTKKAVIGLFGVQFEDVVERPPIQIRVGGATVFVLDVAEFFRC